MMGAKQMKFCEAVARALLIGVKFDGLNGVQIGSGSKMGKLQKGLKIECYHRNVV